MATPRCCHAFRRPASRSPGTRACRSRPGNDEWLVIDVDSAADVPRAQGGRRPARLRGEASPARLAQFVSSGMKNVKKEIASSAGCSASAFLADRTSRPPSGCVWDDNTPEPIKPPPGGRFRPPSATGSAGAGRRPGRELAAPGRRSTHGRTSSWRADVIQDRAPRRRARRSSCGRRRCPTFDPTDVEGSYRNDREGARRPAPTSSASPRRFCPEQPRADPLRASTTTGTSSRARTSYVAPAGQERGGGRQRVPRPARASSARAAEARLRPAGRRRLVSVLSSSSASRARSSTGSSSSSTTSRDDPLLQRALEADLGLPPGSLDRVKQVKRPDLSRASTRTSRPSTRTPRSSTSRSRRSRRTSSSGRTSSRRRRPRTRRSSSTSCSTGSSSTPPSS